MESSAFTASGKNRNQWSHLNSQDFGLLLIMIFPCTISIDYCNEYVVISILKYYFLFYCNIIILFSILYS